jgi:hypothetical protein
VGTGLIYAAIVVAWAAYLLPLVRHHREQPSATQAGRDTGAMRVLGKRSSGARARISTPAEPAEPVRDNPTEADIAVPVEVSRPRYNAAARRRRVLFLILATAVVIGVFAFVGMVAWWSLAVPGGLLVVFVVLARLSVRATRAARRRAENALARSAEPVDAAVPVASASRGLRRNAALTAAAEVFPAGIGATSAPATATTADLASDPAAVWVAHSPVDAWDPLPVTLPTYVTKDAAPARRVRTIDLSGAAAFSAGRLPEAELLARQPETVEELSAGTGRADDEGTNRAATG